MTKVMRTFRLSETTIENLKLISERENVTMTTAIERSIDKYVRSDRASGGSMGDTLRVVAHDIMMVADKVEDIEEKRPTMGLG